MKKRIPYIILFSILLLAEILIALFIDDSFIRPYMGDVIVVWVVYAFAEIFLAGKHKFAAAAGTFCFAAFVEFLQAVNIVGILGLENIPFFRTLIGTRFDLKDIICYAAGTCITMLIISIKKICGNP